MLKAVIFDFDGTLVSTIDLHIESSQKALEKLGIKVDPEDVRDEIGKSLDEIVEDLAKKYPEIRYIDINEVIRIKRELFYQNLDKVKLLRGSRELLSLLKDNGIKIGLATSSLKDFVYTILERFNILDYFDVIVTAEDVSRAKPDPEIFIKTLELLKVRPYEALVIEDSSYGVIAAKRAGIPVYVVLTGVSNKRTLEKLHPNRIFKDLYEIYLYFKNNGFKTL